MSVWVAIARLSASTTASTWVRSSWAIASPGSKANVSAITAPRSAALSVSMSSRSAVSVSPITSTAWLV